MQAASLILRVCPGARYMDTSQLSIITVRDS
nr:MAG TPA: hypothetical protein [Caudoviricetes sp.]